MRTVSHDGMTGKYGAYLLSDGEQTTKTYCEYSHFFKVLLHTLKLTSNFVICIQIITPANVMIVIF